MRGKRTIVSAVAFVLLGAACGGGGGGSANPSPSSQGQQGGTYSFANCEPKKLIPQSNYEACGSQVFEALFTRLMDFAPNTNKPVPAQAQSVTSPDSKVWTIKIKPGWTFHNGEPVTAQSYVDAWNWTALGSNGAILNFFFAKIEGYDALNPSKGKATATELSGLKVIDDTTFQVTLSAPFSQFPIQLGFDAFDPLPKAFYNNPDAFNENPIGDGPYMMDGAWKHDETINLQRYPDYAGTPGMADKIELKEYSSSDAAWADFQAGNVDISLVDSTNLLDAQKAYSDTLQRQPSSIILFLGLPTYQPEFQNKLVRQALSLAVDRQAVMNAVLVAETPATSFAPAVVPGFQEASCKYCHLDVALAKQKLAAAGGWQGPMTVSFYANDSSLEQAMEAIANQWRQNLGIQDIKLSPVNYNSYYDMQVGHKFLGPWWDGWSMDYPSLEDYIRPLYSKNSGSNFSGYSNPAVDKLLAQGDAASTLDASIGDYQQAENLVAEDMPVIPWGYLPFSTVNQPTVTNVTKAPAIDSLALEKVQVVGG